MFKFLKILHQNQRGILQFEAGLALSTLAAVSLTYETDAIEKEQLLDYQQEADLGRQHYYALSNYVVNNRDQIEIDTQTNPVTVSTADLIANGTLPASFTGTSIFGKTLNGVIIREAPFRYSLHSFTTGGQELDDASVAKIARYMGARGSAVYSSNTTQFRSNKGTFIEPLADFAGSAVTPTIGSYGIQGFHGFNENNPDYVSRSRDDAGANAMNVNFDMNSNDIENIDEIRAAGIADGSGFGSEEIIASVGLAATHPTGIADVNATPNTLATRTATGTLKVADPVDDDDAATKSYVDDLGGGGGSSGLWRPNANSISTIFNPTNGTTRTNIHFQGENKDRVVNCSFSAYRVGSAAADLANYIIVYHHDVSENNTQRFVVNRHYLAHEFSDNSSAVEGLSVSPLHVNNLLLEDEDYISVFMFSSISGSNYYRTNYSCHANDI